MFTEDNSTGFFSKFKTIFSSSEKNESAELLENCATEEESTNDLSAVKEAEAPVYSNSGFNMNESVTEKEISLRTVEVSAPRVTMPTEKDLDIRFATKFLEAGGKFIYCETIKDAVENIALLKAEHKWSHVFAWENEIKDAFCNYNFQRGAIGFTIENSDAAISLCESLIADEGTILLNPKQASRRRLPCFPKTHILITDVAHLIGTESEGLEKFYQKNKGELPAIIKMGFCNNGHFYDKARLILNAEGTEDIYVFLVGELIPVSLRP